MMLRTRSAVKRRTPITLPSQCEQLIVFASIDAPSPRAPRSLSGVNVC